MNIKEKNKAEFVHEIMETWVFQKLKIALKL